jgi:hypothetical protein
MTIAPTPEGQIVLEETPSYDRHDRRDELTPWGAGWLGEPNKRYGPHIRASEVTIEQMLEMLTDPVIMLASSFVSALLVNATYVIECNDPIKQAFFKDMYDAVHEELMLASLPALLLGAQGLIKQLELVAPDRFPSWPGVARPLAFVGVEQIHPTVGEPHFEDRTFAGIKLAGDEHVPVFYSLWLTRAKHLAFGDYRGVGRLRAAWHPYWNKYFSLDLYAIYMQKNVQPTPVIEHPAGKDPVSGKSYREIALQIAKEHMAGAPITVPSEPYKTRNKDGAEEFSSIRKWALNYKQSGGDVSQFHEIRDVENQEMAMALLIPPQALMDARMTSLGGKSTAEVFSDLAGQVLVLDAAEHDRHLNDYLFPAISRANFPPDSPPVTKRTTGLNTDDRALLGEVATSLIGRDDIDMVTLMERLNLPRAKERAPVGRFARSSTNDKMEHHAPHVRDAHTTYLAELTAAKRPQPEDQDDQEDGDDVSDDNNN